MATAETADRDHRVIFGNRIRDLRKARGFSQEALAHASNIDRTYVSGVERGQRNIALDNIVRLAKALDVHPSELFL